MRRSVVAESPAAYVEALGGWQRSCVEALRRAVRSVEKLEEVLKWGHLVYLSNGPVMLIRAEESRVLLGYWRGQRLAHMEPRLKAGGKYEMATVELREGAKISATLVQRLTEEAVALNTSLGDPTRIAKSDRPSKPPGAKRGTRRASK